MPHARAQCPCVHTHVDTHVHTHTHIRTHRYMHIHTHAHALQVGRGRAVDPAWTLFQSSSKAYKNNKRKRMWKGLQRKMGETLRYPSLFWLQEQGRLAVPYLIKALSCFSLQSPLRVSGPVGQPSQLPSPFSASGSRSRSSSLQLFTLGPVTPLSELHSPSVAWTGLVLASPTSQDRPSPW